MHNKAGNIPAINGPQVVAAVHTMNGLALAQRLPSGAVDFLEIRLDAFAAMESGMTPLVKALPKLKIPLIVTARDFREGGAGRLTTSQRRELLLHSLPFTTLVDIELRNADAMAEVVEAARKAGVGVILSAHDFSKTPQLKRLREMAKRAAKYKPAIFKFAGAAKTTRDLSILLEFLAVEKKLPLAVMGMGRRGKLSRVMLGGAGSVLNYGYLDEANASGQWPARLLKERLREIADAETTRKA